LFHYRKVWAGASNRAGSGMGGTWRGGTSFSTGGSSSAWMYLQINLHLVVGYIVNVLTWRNKCKQQEPHTLLHVGVQIIGITAARSESTLCVDSTSASGPRYRNTGTTATTHSNSCTTKHIERRFVPNSTVQVMFVSLGAKVPVHSIPLHARQSVSTRI
jgi:hypothetical protein